MSDNNDKNESLISHLEALRQTLLKCLISLACVLPFALFIAPKALNCLIKILVGNYDIKFNYFSPAEVFILQVKIALVIDIMICFPYIAKKLWDFILPALYEHEKKFIKSIVFVSSLLFICGVLFCLFVMLPFIISFGMSFATSNIQAVFGISNVINLSLWLSIVFGFMFEIPLITHSLIKWGIVDYETIADKRPYVIVGLLIIAAILTPPDVLSQLILFIPTYTLFELGLFFSKRKSIGRKDKNTKIIQDSEYLKEVK